MAQKLFSRILVPVNFNRNSRWSIEKGVQLANKFDCDILLLHAQAPPSTFPYLNDGFFSGSFIKANSSDVQLNIKNLETYYKPKLKEGLMMNTATIVGYWHSVMKDVIISEHIDLVLVPKNRKRLSTAVIRRININKLSQQTKCPIMTITRNFNVNQLQNIVVPVFDLLPVKKLTMATYLSIETRGCIYLMGKHGPVGGGEENRYMIGAYQLLNELGKMNVQCAIVDDNEDRGGSTLAYAKDVKASLIVVSSGKESRLKGWWNKLRGKYLTRESDIPVLTVTS